MRTFLLLYIILSPCYLFCGFSIVIHRHQFADSFPQHHLYPNQLFALLFAKSYHTPLPYLYIALLFIITYFPAIWYVVHHRFQSISLLNSPIKSLPSCCNSNRPISASLSRARYPNQVLYSTNCCLLCL